MFGPFAASPLRLGDSPVRRLGRGSPRGPLVEPGGGGRRAAASAGGSRAPIAIGEAIVPIAAVGLGGSEGAEGPEDAERRLGRGVEEEVRGEREFGEFGGAERHCCFLSFFSSVALESHWRGTRVFEFAVCTVGE